MFLGRKKVSLDQYLIPALYSVFGLGKSRINNILCKLGGVRKTKLVDIHPNKRKGLSKKLLKKYSTETELHKPIRKILRNHYIHGSYKGIRFSQGLPANGQRTHTNRSTASRLRRVTWLSTKTP